MWTGRGDGSWWTEQPKGEIEFQSSCIQSSNASLSITAKVVECPDTNGKKIEISGFEGQHAAKINGIYERQDDDSISNPNLLSYKKSDHVDRWLEYHAGTMTWQIKPPNDKGKAIAYNILPSCLAFNLLVSVHAFVIGKDACWAYNVNPKSTLPQKASSVWVAKDAFERQDNGRITVLAYDTNFRVM
jgi:hypothetical protein